MRNNNENICFLPIYWLTDMEVYKMAAISIMLYTPQTNYTLRLIICLLISRNFPLPRSA